MAWTTEINLCGTAMTVHPSWEESFLVCLHGLKRFAFYVHCNSLFKKKLVLVDAVKSVPEEVNFLLSCRRFITLYQVIKNIICYNLQSSLAEPDTVDNLIKKEIVSGFMISTSDTLISRPNSKFKCLTFLHVSSKSNRMEGLNKTIIVCNVTCWWCFFITKHTCTAYLMWITLGFTEWFWFI